MRLAGADLRQKFRHLARRTRAHHVIHQIVAERSARISKPFGMLSRSGVQQDASRFKRLRAQDHGPSPNLVRFVRDAVHVRRAPNQ